MRAFQFTLCVLLLSNSVSAGVIASVAYNQFSAGRPLGQLSAHNSVLLGHVTAAGNTVDYTTLFDSASLDAADSLWIATGATSQTLSATEATNLTNFINSGRRVVLHGEHASWATWNNSIFSVLGGVAENVTYAPSGNRSIIANSNGLTDGVSEINLPFWSNVQSGSRIDLVSGGAVSVWGPTDNVLLFLDGNWMNDALTGSTNQQFMQNIGGWLADSSSSSSGMVPEPSSATLFGLGFAGLFLRRNLRQ